VDSEEAFWALELVTHSLTYWSVMFILLVVEFIPEFVSYMPSVPSQLPSSHPKLQDTKLSY
jgi:hypothetical protein